MMNLVFEKITQTLAAGQQVISNIAGDFFRLSVAPYPVTVALLKNQRIVGTMAGMLAGDYVKDMDFDGVVITNGETAQNVTFQIAGGGAGSDRVLGEVSVINGEVQRVKAGLAFIGRSSITATAGQYAHCQLWNPAGSGKNIILNKMTVCSSVAQHFLGAFHNAALATLHVKGSSKLQGGAASVMECREEAPVTLVGNTQIFNFDIGAGVVGTSVDYAFSEPLIITPGSGFVLGSMVVAAQLSLNYQWVEEAI